MKKIILVLLVLFCGMGLFAEVQEFGVGYTFSARTDSSNIIIFPALPYSSFMSKKVYFEDSLTYFSKVKPTGDGYFEVELYQCNGELDGKYFTFLVKKGDKFDMLMAFFDEINYINPHSYNLVNFNSTILDIRPNLIVIEFEIPTE